jgi:hypothetical protein
MSKRLKIVLPRPGPISSTHKGDPLGATVGGVLAFFKSLGVEAESQYNTEKEIGFTLVFPDAVTLELVLDAQGQDNA